MRTSSVINVIGIVVLFICFEKCFCGCKQSHVVICDTIQDFEKEEQLSWSDVMIKPKSQNDSVIEVLDFLPLRRVQNLAIVGHTIKKFGSEIFCFYKTHLKFLSLYGNKLATIPSNSFPKGLRLTKLVMVNNQIETIERGTFTAPQIDTIDLSDNLLEVIHRETFSQNANSSTRAIFLNNNRLAHIEPDTFPPSLRILNLDNNQLRYLQDDVFSKLKDLRGLYLNNNKLLSAPKLQEFKNLVELELSQNNIDVISSNTFQNLKKLRVLDLSRNKIKEVGFLNSILLRNLEATLDISLALNRLTKLDIDIDPSVSLEANSLILFGNPWNCNNWPSIESYMNRTKIRRTDCDLQYFNSGKVPYCIPTPAFGITDVHYFDGIQEKFRDLVKSDSIGCKLVLEKNQEAMLNMLRTSQARCYTR